MNQLLLCAKYHHNHLLVFNDMRKRPKHTELHVTDALSLGLGFDFSVDQHRNAD